MQRNFFLSNIEIISVVSNSPFIILFLANENIAVQEK